jgi:hypothetical protein
MLLHKSSAPSPKRVTRKLPSSRKNEAAPNDPVAERSSSTFLFYWSRPLGAPPNSFRLIVKPKKYQLNFGSYWALSSTLPELLREIRQAHRTVHTLEVVLFHSSDGEDDLSLWSIIAEELQRSCTSIRTLVFVTTCHSSSFWTCNVSECTLTLISALRLSVQLIQLGVPPAQSQPPSSLRNDRGNISLHKDGVECYSYESLWSVLKHCVLLNELCLFGGPPMELNGAGAAVHMDFFQSILPRLQSLQLHNVRLNRMFFETMMECVEQYTVVPRLDHIGILQGQPSLPNFNATARSPPKKHTYSIDMYLQFMVGLHSWRWKLLEQREGLIQKYLQKQRLCRSVQCRAPVHSVHEKEEEEDDTFKRLLDAAVMIVRDWYRSKYCVVVAAPPVVCAAKSENAC